MSEVAFEAHLLRSVADLPADEWDALAGPDNPFVSHAFLSGMEQSASVGGQSGWDPLPIVIKHSAGRPGGALRASAKARRPGE